MTCRARWNFRVFSLWFVVLNYYYFLSPASVSYHHTPWIILSAPRTLSCTRYDRLRVSCQDVSLPSEPTKIYVYG